MENLDEQLAVALVAQMAGNDLVNVNHKMVEKGTGAHTDLIDPRTLLTGFQQHKAKEQQSVVAAQDRLAEQIYPLPTPGVTLPDAAHTTPKGKQKKTVVADDDVTKILRSLDRSFKRIAVALESIKDNGIGQNNR